MRACAQGDNDVEVYVGLKKIVVTYDDETESALWTDEVCSEDYCDQCKRACQRSSMVAIVALLTSLPQVTTDLVRARAASDLNCQVIASLLRAQTMGHVPWLTLEPCDCVAVVSMIGMVPTTMRVRACGGGTGFLRSGQKITGVLTGLIGTLGILSALGVYLDGCYRNLPDNIVFGDVVEADVMWELGPGFICLVAATCIRPINFFVHLLTPTPSHKRRSMHESLLRASSGV